MISVAMLGPVEVRRHGDRVPVPAGKTTEVLMHLALAAGAMVRTERLFEDIWGEDAATTGVNALQSKVSQLRRALGDPQSVVGHGAGYSLAVDARDVDALEVVRLADAAAALRAAGDPASCVETCSQALALYRGESLFGASDAEWLAPHRTHLDAVRLRLVELRLAARLDLGDAGEVVGELEALCAAHPLREGLAALLVTALYRDGRQADALAVARRVREHLAEELGLDPGPELQALERQVLEQDPRLGAPDRPARPAPRPTGSGLPPISSSMVGRDHDLTTLLDRLRDHRLVTVVGPAGVGKTRLAIEAARAADPGDGTWLVRLESATDATAVPETVAAALHANGTTPEDLAARFRGAEALVVLDNCEHVVEAAVLVADALLRAGPGVRVLATSQLPLGVDGESVHALEPLPIDDARRLFAERTREHGRGAALAAGTESSVDDVCRALDGLPLAIELAAARTKSLSVDEIAARLDDRFTLLADPTSRRPERQRRLAAAIGWSYDLLFPDDQRGLWALACFVGGAPLGGAEHVLAALGVPPAAAVDVVSRLVDRSLVTVDAGIDGSVRYRLLDSVRSFSREQLDAAGETATARRAHAEWIAGRAAAAAAGVRGPDQSTHVAFARSERADIEAALTWTGEHEPGRAVAIAGDLGWTWVVLGDALGAVRLRTALAAGGAEVDPDRRVATLLVTGWLEASAGDVAQAMAALDAAEALLDPDDDGARAAAQLHRAYVLSQQGRFRESLDLLVDARITFRALGHEWGDATGWVITAHRELGLGDAGAARIASTEAAVLLERVRDPWLSVHAEAMLGGVAQSEHRFADACTHLARAATAADAAGFAATAAYHLANLGRAQQQHGDLDAAAAGLGRAIEIASATGDLRVAALARTRLGRVLLAEGDRERARATLQAAHRWYEQAGGGDGARLAACLLATVPTTDEDARLRELERVLADARDAADSEVAVLALDALALARADAGDPAGAAELLLAADALVPAARHHLVDADRLDAHAARSLLRA